MKKIQLTALLLLFIIFGAAAQTDTTKKAKQKKGIKWGGGVPVIAYDSDIGFKYGALTYIYDYGDGTVYPNYLQSLYLEWSRTTKGSGINEIMFDSKKLFHQKVRFLADVNYLTEQALDFYGFNGYEANYNSKYEDQDDTSLYRSRMYYRHERKMLKITTDFQGKILGNKLRWVAGYGFYGVNIDAVDVDKLNKGKDAADLLPANDTTTSLYLKYVADGLISSDEKDGGNVHMLKAGVVYDTRDNEACPMKGIWTEVLFLSSPEFMGNKSGYSQMTFTHRQYFTIIPVRLSFAYRLGYQTKLSGKVPFFMLPFYYNTTQTRDGFGGAKTLRGILRNRVVGDGIAFGNAEIRWKAIKTVIFKQDFYIGLSAFLDGGRVVSPYKIDYPVGISSVKIDDEKWHLSTGGGIRFAINENFIIAVDYGRTLKEQDGDSGLYIGLSWLF